MAEDERPRLEPRPLFYLKGKRMSYPSQRGMSEVVNLAVPHEFMLTRRLGAFRDDDDRVFYLPPFPFAR